MRDYEELVETLRLEADGFLMDDVPDMLMADSLNDAADAIEDLIAALTASNEVIAKSRDKWISVENALPEKNGRYLVRYKRDIVLDYTEVHDDEARIMRFFVGDGWRYPFLCQPELRKAEQQTVTHWMALPGLPVEENTNGK